MNISPKERFLDICHFKRPGELYILPNIRWGFGWKQTLENWVEQGAPREIVNRRFRRDYFQFRNVIWLESESGTIGGTIGEVDEGLPPEKTLGPWYHGRNGR